MSQEDFVISPVNTPTDEKEKENLGLSCNQPNNINDKEIHSDVGSDKVTEENSSTSKSDVLNPVKETKTNQTKAMYEFFKSKWNEFLIDCCSKLDAADLNVKEDLRKLINFEINNETTNIETVSHKGTDPERPKTEEKCESIQQHTLPKQSLEVTESVSGLCMESDKAQNLNSQSDSSLNSQEVIKSCDSNLHIENNAQQNLNFHCENHSQDEEHIEIGLSDEEFMEFMVRAEKENAEMSEENLNSDGTNTEQRDQIKESREDSYPHEEIHEVYEKTICSNAMKKSQHDHESSMTTSNFCNSTDKTQGGFSTIEESFASIHWKLRREVTPTTCVNNNVKQVLAKYNTNRYRRKQTRQYYRGALYPMDDKHGPFFIDRRLVNVNMYQEGLEFKDWNPVQVVYEICTGSDWGMPEFEQETYIKDYGFIFSLKLKGHKFNSQKLASTKKKAKCFASAYFLQYLGFKFNFENLPNTSVNHNTSDTNWQKRVNASVKLSSNYMAEDFPPYRRPSDSASQELAGFLDLRTKLNKRQHGYNSDSEKDSQYDKKKRNRYLRKIL